MSFFKKLFPFLFKSEKSESTPKPSSKGPQATAKGNNGAKSNGTKSKVAEKEEAPANIVAFGIVAKVKNARGLRKGSKAYVRSILLEDGDRLRVRGTAPNGNKVTITVPRRSLSDYQSEGVPEHVAKHYDNHSLFKEEHEARMKAEALGKH